MQERRMTEKPNRWPRPHFRPSGLRMKQSFICFAPSGGSELKFSSSEMPRGHLASLVDLRVHHRAEAREWFEGWWKGVFGVHAKRDLDEDYDQLVASEVCYRVTLELDDQPDLVSLQTSWAIVRALCRLGATIVLDVPALMFRPAAEILGWSCQEFDIVREVQLVFETEGDAAHEGRHLLHSRGMVKFARPDLVAWIRPEDNPLMGGTTNAFARILAEGGLPKDMKSAAAKELGIEIGSFEDHALLEQVGLETAIELRQLREGNSSE